MVRKRQLYEHHKLMEKQAKEQAIVMMVAAGEMVPGASLALDAQNAQQVRPNELINGRMAPTSCFFAR